MRFVLRKRRRLLRIFGYAVVTSVTVLLIVNKREISFEDIPSFLEKNFRRIRNNSSHKKKSLVCSIPKQARPYPFCASKCKNFGDEKCFAQNGVNMTDLCSILRYLSEVESWCPISPNRQFKIFLNSEKNFMKAQINRNLTELMWIMKYDKLKWLRERITGLWSEWMKATKSLEITSLNLISRKKWKILMFLGTFAISPVWLDGAYNGYPLGELVQWSDLIASLYIMGHNLTVASQEEDFQRYFYVADQDGCISPHNQTLAEGFDVIFIDLNGLMRAKKIAGPHYSKLRCKLRILDSFGTEAEFNYANYKGNIAGGRSQWGNQDLDLRQFMTMFPHSPDNTFLGFVSGVKMDSDEMRRVKSLKRNQALIYGKLFEFWKSKDNFLSLVNKYFTVHATASGEGEQPHSFVTNHGIVTGGKLREILQKSKVFLGVGFPFEGPAPLEAIASGAVFINPKLKQPLNRVNSDFFGGKPTLRNISSQNPYLEEFVGEPYVHTIDIDNFTLVEEILQKIRQKQVEPFLPLEFTHEGMLQRVAVLLENQDFCSGKLWPPLSALKLVLGNKGASCKDSCWKKGLICEPGFWETINQDSFMKSLANCVGFKSVDQLHAPSFDPVSGDCYKQADVMLFSCVAKNVSVRRVCPCRDFIKEQVALCKQCV